MAAFDGERPEIQYPCRWSYRIIGTSDADMRAAVIEIVGAAEHSLEASNASSGGKYVSLHLTVLVESDEHRLSVYRRIGRVECVRMVM